MNKKAGGHQSRVANNGGLIVPRKIALAVASAASILLASCGGGGSDSDVHSDGDEEFHIESSGRLAITEAGASGVHVLDLDGRSVFPKIETSFVPTALYASPDRRYAVAIQRNDDFVQFVDGGLWQEDHGDHLHDYEAAPVLLANSLTGLAPTHYEVADGAAALFMDGDAETAQQASVVTLSDAKIADGDFNTTLTLERQMHGTAEPRGEYLLTTWRAPDTTSTLPEQVELYRQDGTSFEFVERFDVKCPSLHGSYSNEDYSVFGCSDGVLVVHQDGDVFTASKLDTPADMPADTRIGTIIGSHESPSFVGVASSQYLFEIDPVNQQITTINTLAGQTFAGLAFTADADSFLALDKTGTLHILNPDNGWTSTAALALNVGESADGVNEALEVHPAEDIAYVTDPQGSRIVVVDVESAAISDQFPVSFVPSYARWLGVAGEHEHEHE